MADRKTAFGRLAPVAIVAGALLAVSMANAQQPAPPAKAPPKAAAPAAPPKAPDAKAPPQTAWVKLCEEVPVNEKGEKKKLCLTHHERLEGNTGMVLVSAALRQIDGVEKADLLIMVPLGMMIKPGVGAVFGKANDKGGVDVEPGAQPILFPFALCHQGGCTAEIQATPELIAKLKAGGDKDFMIVRAMGANGKPYDAPVPLIGFSAALSGAPVDSKAYGDARRQLMEQIYQRQVEMVEAARKQAAEKAGQPPAAPAATPPAAAPPAAAPPAKAPPAATPPKK